MVTEYNWQAFRALFRIPEVDENARAKEESIQEMIDEGHRLEQQVPEYFQQLVE